MFNVIAKPLTVEAVFTESAVCYIIATVAFSLGLSVVVNHPNWGDACIDIYNEYIGPAAKSKVDSIIDTFHWAPSAQTAYLVLAEWEKNEWEEITDGIIRYMNENSVDTTMITVSTSENSNGLIGFTKDTRFYFTVDHNLDLNDKVVVNLGESILTMCRYSSSDFQSIYPEVDPVPSITDYPLRVLEIISNDLGLKYVECFHQYRNSADVRADTFSSRNRGSVNSSQLLNSGFSIASDNNGYLFTPFKRFGSSDSSRNGFYDSQGYYYTPEEINNKWALVNMYTNEKYRSMEFDSYSALVAWFCQHCGLAVSFDDSGSNNVSVYDPSSDLPITGDTTAAAEKAREVADNAAATDSPIVTTLPTTDTMLDVVAENPAVILDPAQAAVLDIPVKPADLPEIDTGKPALWTTKFPFCLPFDIYRLVADFSAEPECPKLSLLLMPENSFGMQNEEITVEIDFEPFDKVVKILRFFLALGFVFFLIKITRKLIS